MTRTCTLFACFMNKGISLLSYSRRNDTNQLKNSTQAQLFYRVNRREYRCLIRTDVGRGYRVTCPELPLLLTYGGTLEEARDNAGEEIVAWNGQEVEPLPEPDRAIWYNRRI